MSEYLESDYLECGYTLYQISYLQPGVIKKCHWEERGETVSSQLPHKYECVYA